MECAQENIGNFYEIRGTFSEATVWQHDRDVGTEDVLHVRWFGSLCTISSCSNYPFHFFLTLPPLCLLYGQRALAWIDLAGAIHDE